MDTSRAPETPSVRSPESAKQVGQSTSSTIAPKTAQASLATYKFAKQAKRWHSHASKIAGAFDPSLNDDFGGDDSDDSNDSTDSEDSHDDTDDETDSVCSWHSDDQSIHDDADTTTDNAHEQNSNTATHASSSEAMSSATKGISKDAKTLPVTRPAKVSELIPSSSPTALPNKDSSPRSVPSPSIPVESKAKIPTTASAPVQPKATKPVGPVASLSLPVESRPSIPTTVSAPAQPKDPKPVEAQNPTAKQPHAGKKEAKNAVPMQIIKVRKPDGTIIKVRRPIKPTPSGDTAKSAVEKSPTIETKTTPKLPTDSAPRNRGTVSSPILVREDATTPSQASKETKPATILSEKGDKPVIILTEREITGTISSEDPSRLPPAQTNAQSLARRTSKFAQVTIWSIMIALPLVFLILAILTASVTGKPENDSLGKAITAANNIAVSLWPIAYAAIAAQALRMYASYKVERGLRLMTLEQLISSHSVASAIKQPFLLQRFTTTSLALLLLWSLSPLAGQAFLRMSTLGPSGAISNTTLQYLDTTVDSVTFSGVSSSGQLGPSVNNLYGSCILSPLTSQASPMDSWGNIKVPLTSSTSWTAIPSTDVSYSSLIGVPVGSIPSSGNTTFIMPSAYFSFQQCTAMVSQTLDEITTTLNSSSLSLSPATSGTLRMSIMPPVLPDSPQGTLFYASRLDGGNFAYTTCNFSQIFVESSVSCAANNCSVTETRLVSPTSSIDSRASPVSLLNLVVKFVNAGASTGSSIYTPTQYYIQDPSSAGRNDFRTDPDPSKLPISTFTARLSLLINTYWLAGIAPYDFTGVIQTDGTGDVTPLHVTGTVASTAPVYRTNWGWFALLLFSTVLLLVGGVVGAYLDHHTIGPDIFGFASSLARKNKHIRFVDEEEAASAPLPGSGVASRAKSGTMGGAERTRLLGDVRVMLKDVRPGKAVGRIALGSVDKGAEGERLVRGRLYK